MKLKLFSVLALALCGVSLQAQNAFMEGVKTHLDEFSVDARATFHQEVRNGKYDTHFQGDYFNLHLMGHITNNLSFRIRQRMNKRIDEKNPFSATDFLWLKWQINPRWAITGGKHPIMIGGYEIDSPPIDVYYYGAFSDNLSQVYAFGVSATFTPTPDQSISVQFCPSPISPVTQNAYSYNLYWNGHIGSRWKTIWSYNLVEDEYHRMMNWFVLGNKFTFGPLAVDIDLIDRFSFRQRNPLSDWSIIGKAILTLGKWNLCTKVGYERNGAENVDENGISYDLILQAGHNYFYGGAGVEFFPLGTDRLRLHFAYFRNNHDHLDNLDFGLTWRFTIYKR